MSSPTKRLLAAVQAVAPGAMVRVGTRGDSKTVTVDPPEQQAAAQPVIDAFDWSDAAQAAWELAQNRTVALTTSLSRADDTAISVRAWLKAILFLVNNRLESLGQTRVTEAEIMTYIQSNPNLGDPS